MKSRKLLDAHRLPLFGSRTDAQVSSASSPIKTIIHIMSECYTAWKNNVETVQIPKAHKDVLTITF